MKNLKIDDDIVVTSSGLIFTFLISPHDKLTKLHVHNWRSAPLNITISYSINCKIQIFLAYFCFRSLNPVFDSRINEG